MMKLRTALLFTALLLAVSRAMAGEVEKEIEVPANNKVVVENAAGDVRVETWDKATLWYRAELGEDCRGVDELNDAGITKIKVNVGAKHGGSSIRADVTVRVPLGCDVSVETLSANVNATRMQRSLDVESASGEIHVEFHGTRLNLKSISGDISVNAVADQAELQTASGDITGTLGAQSLRVDSVSGDVSLEGEQERATISTTSGEVSHNGVAKRLQVDSVSGDIRVARVTAAAELVTSGGDINAHGRGLTELRAESIGGDIRFEGTLDPTCVVDVSSKGGDVVLALPPDTPARYELSSFSGDIEGVDFLNDDEHHGPGKQVEYFNASATAQVTAKSFSGDIRIEEYTAAE